MESKAYRRATPVVMLSLDGGGVRGLSSLLILKELLRLVKKELVQQGVLPADHAVLKPQDVFDIAVGTSTGGLIALMMVKLDMSIDDCIVQYKQLSRQLFSKQRPHLQRIFGSDWSKFSGKRLQTAVENLLATKKQPHNLGMRTKNQQNSMQGAVVCHERKDVVKNCAELSRPDPVFLCTQACSSNYQGLECEVRQAARATSAAPSYFEAAEIQDRLFVDGGYGSTNNPSLEAWYHYHRYHGFSEHRFIIINIGTGTLPSDCPPIRQKRPWWTIFLPHMVVPALGLLYDLEEMATQSETPATHLKRHVNKTYLFFKRFSADTGIHDIKLDDWRAVTSTKGPSDIEQKTETYIRKSNIEKHLRTAAEQLADAYLDRRARGTSSNSIEEQTLDDISLSSGSADRRPQTTASATTPGFPELNVPLADQVPSLTTASESAHTPGPSIPPTPPPPEPAISGSGPPLAQLSIAPLEDVLQCEGRQLESKVSLSQPMIVPRPELGRRYERGGGVPRIHPGLVQVLTY